MHAQSWLRLGLAAAVALPVAVGKPDSFSSSALNLLQSLLPQRWLGTGSEHELDAASCSRCLATLLSLKSVAALGDKPFIDALTRSCVISKTQDPEVCRGALELEGPILAAAIRNMVIGSKTSKLFCAGILGSCDYPEVEEWSVPFPSEKPSRGRPSPSGKQPLKVVHFSDVHIDPQYTEGTNTHCGKPICCRPYTDADEPGNNDSPAGPYGDHNCDSPMSLEASMYQAIKKTVPDAAFAIFTGDVVDHAVWATTQPSNKDAISHAYENMARSLGLVYGTAGNHEAHPTNAYQPVSVGDTAQWIYDLLSEQWSRWISEKESAVAERLGMYSAKYPNGNLRIISLNTNMFYRQNFWLYQREMIRDPNNYIAWLVKELDSAEKAGENVYLIGHMSIGDKNTFHDASNYLDQIVNRYSATIAGMFFGHTHRDEFQITYSDYGDRSYPNARIASYIGPSLTPTSGMPSFRVYDIDPVTFGVLDFTVYSADMRDKAFQTTGPVWKKYYSAKEVYGPVVSPPVKDATAELTAGFWHNVTAVMETNPSVFEAFMARKSRGWLREHCEDGCKSNEICQLRAARSQDNCFTPVEGIREANSEGRHDHDECGYSVAGATLVLLFANDALIQDLASWSVNEL
ncbi:Metallo-dependent phosphatase-like protein [Stachybotrys elegans]|uniref:Sphingomyelin phosphodiesterase n=1 Tax=Stachybotrys elegans TaxID=80388 RepID=A0A8K0SWF8_9HYPO|nr:Metallo-dependent phosphatase-like protein [Stachybotrys elegans]